MNASLEAVDGDIVLKFKKFLVEEGENKISVNVPQKFTYAFVDTFGEEHGSNRDKALIELNTGEVLVRTETGNDIIIYSDGKFRMQYVVSNTDSDIRYETQETMDDNLTASNISGFVALGLPAESGGMVGAQSVVGIPQYNIIFNYEPTEYSDQADLTEKQQTLMDASVESVDGDIVLKYKKLLVEEGGYDIIVDITHKFINTFADTVGEVHVSNRGKSVIYLSSGGTCRVSDPNQGKWLAHGILAGLSWGFLRLLDFGATLL